MKSEIGRLITNSDHHVEGMISTNLTPSTQEKTASNDGGVIVSDYNKTASVSSPDEAHRIGPQSECPGAPGRKKKMRDDNNEEKAGAEVRRKRSCRRKLAFNDDDDDDDDDYKYKNKMMMMKERKLPLFLPR